MSFDDIYNWFGLIFYALLTVMSTLIAIKETIEEKNITAVSILNHLLMLITSCDEEQESIVGDLLEEFNEFPSRLYAHLWLYKQVLKSVLPLAYKSVKSRLASYFGELVR